MTSYRSSGGGISGKELDQFDRTLARFEGAMHVDNIDGFFSALIVSPVVSLPVAWFPEVFGGEMPEFETMEDAEEVIAILTGLWNRAAVSIDDGTYAPAFKRAKDDSGKMHVSPHQWAFGFFHGMERHYEPWSAVNDELGDLPYPIVTIIEDGHALMSPKTADEGFPLDSGVRDELMASIPSAVLGMRDYWRESKR